MGVFLLLLVTITYEYTFGGYFQGDDFVILAQDVLAESPLSRLIQRCLHGNGAFYRPFGSLLFFLDFQFWGTNAAGYHTTNILLHFLTTLAIAQLIYLLSKNIAASVWTGILFAVHPVHVEPVAWISGRFDVLSACCYVATVVLYVSAHNKSGRQKTLLYTSSLITCCAAFLSKEMSATLPFILLLISLWYGNFSQVPSPQRPFRWWPIMRPLLPYFGLFTLYLIWRTYALGGIGGYGSGQGSAHVGFSAEMIISLIHKLNRLTLPILSFQTYRPLVFLSLVLLVTILMPRHFQFGALWIIVTLLPVLTLYLEGEVHNSLAERYLYLPSVGFGFFVAGLFDVLRTSFRRPAFLKRLAVWSLLVITSLYCFQSTRSETRLWRNASDIARTIPLEVKSMFPNMSQGWFFLEHLPDNFAGAYIYRLGFNIAMKLAYDADLGEQLPDWHLITTNDCTEQGENAFLDDSAFCLRYIDGHIQDVTQEILLLLDPTSARLDPSQYTVPEVIDFRTPGADRLLFKGWASHEQWGRWAIGTTALISIALPSHQSYEFTFKIRTVPVEGERQTVHFWVNDTIITEVLLTQPGWQVITVSVPQTALTGRIEVLKFESDHLTSPGSPGSGRNGQQMAFGIEFLSFRPTL